MNYYPFHIGDYARDTRHLTVLEHGAYRLLIDLYYLREAPLPLDLQGLCRLVCARSDDEILAVKTVLQEFFVGHPDGWRHVRCDEEIAIYRAAKGNHWAAKLTTAQRAAIQAQRNAAKLSATPGWLTKQHRDEIAATYALSATRTASTGVPHNVDHIVPLRSDVVCGLHVPWNLQVITAEANRSKSNSLVAF